MTVIKDLYGKGSTEMPVLLELGAIAFIAIIIIVMKGRGDRS